LGRSSLEPLSERLLPSWQCRTTAKKIAKTSQDLPGRADRLADEVKEQVEQAENVVDMGTLLAILFLHYATRAYLADKLARTAVSRLR